jgi:hypothetical protein
LVELIDKGQIQKLDAYQLFTDLFEDCPESQLEQNFALFKKTQPFIKLPPELLHHCTKVVRTCMSKLTVTHDLAFRGTLQRFLAQTMPLTHMTGVNLLGKFNDTNTTSIETQIELLKSFNTSEYKTYKNFWSIQKYINTPFIIFKQDHVCEFEEIDIDEQQQEDSFQEGIEGIEEEK